MMLRTKRVALSCRTLLHFLYRLPLVSMILGASVLGGCSAMTERAAIPAEVAGGATVPGLAHVRFWGDAAPRDVALALRQRMPSLGKPPQAPKKENGRPLIRYLALSGGGADGAYGAGLLVGWSAAGDRPDFEFVTGISAGALIAPFAFLGPRYDRQLEAIWTGYGDADLVVKQPLAVLFGGTSLVDTAPLAGLIARYVDERLLAAIAAEYRKGRVLLVGTTNLDARRPVVWNMGEIALSRDPGALQLFRDVLLASAAIPGVMPPVKIRVTAAGATFDEYHVDGGVTRQVFLTPVALTLTDFDKFYPSPPLRRIYVIRNGRLEPRYKLAEASAISLASNSISVMLDAQAAGDIYRIYVAALRDGAEFRLAANPTVLDPASSDIFDKSYMREMFSTSRRQARNGYPWMRTVPEVVPSDPAECPDSRSCRK